MMNLKGILKDALAVESRYYSSTYMNNLREIMMTFTQDIIYLGHHL